MPVTACRGQSSPSSVDRLFAARCLIHAHSSQTQRLSFTILRFTLYILLWLFLFSNEPAQAQIATVNHPHGKIKIACGDCHTTKGWSPLRLDLKFKHEQTGFALEGQHASVACKQCHTSLKFEGASKECKACHKDVHDGTLGKNCERCHTAQAWQDVSKIPVVHQASRFPLVGLHQHVGCDNCHTTAGTTQFVNLPLQCGACHQKDFAATTNPNHRQAGFSMRCEQCHNSTITGWQVAGFGGQGFDHSRTSFPLVGAHTTAECAKCHVNGRFAGTPKDCFSCHQNNFQSAANPNHVASNFPKDCQICHNTNIWRPATYDHNKTRFPLLGAHAAVNCSQCHANNRFTGTPTDCFSCHQTDFQRPTNPNHVASNFSKDCQICHNNNSWKPAKFDHNLTAFPLRGAHSTVDCAQCHVNGRYTGTPKDCFSCHQTDFQGVTNPNHVTGNFSHTCTQCHTESVWKPSTFDHNRTSFALAGAHVTVECAKCHVNGRFAGTPKDCFSCHQTDFQNTTNPNHVTSNYPRDCLTCHNSNAWRPANFDHNRTRFPLTGAHLAVSCDLCHVNNRFTGTPTDCFSCHQSNFQSTANPNHVVANFSHTCTSCHTTNAWKPSTFDHSKTRFPLLGAHVTTTCNQCHINNRYAGTPMDCYFCHQADFQRPTNPNHVTLNFAHDCKTCHTMNAWRPATFDHDGQYFRIYSGKHRGKWQSCATCHVNATNYKVFECILCHDHNQTQMDAEHRNKSGYQYNSQSCYKCHPRV